MTGHEAGTAPSHEPGDVPSREPGDVPPRDLDAALAGLREAPLPDGLVDRLVATTAGVRADAAAPGEPPDPDLTRQGPAVTLLPSAGAGRGRQRHLGRDRAGPPSSPGAGAARPGRDRSATARRPPGGRRWLAPASAGLLGLGLLAVLAVGLSSVGGGSDMTAASGGGEAAAESAGSAGAGPQVTASGSKYRPDTLDTQVQALLRGEAADEVAGSPAAAAGESRVAGDVAPEELARSLDPSAPPLSGCLAGLAGAPDPLVLAVDAGTWEGGPALLVVLPGPDGARDAYVVGSGCDGTDEQVRFFVRVPAA